MDDRSREIRERGELVPALAEPLGEPGECGCAGGPRERERNTGEQVGEAEGRDRESCRCDRERRKDVRVGRALERRLAPLEERSGEECRGCDEEGDAARHRGERRRDVERRLNGNRAEQDQRPSAQLAKRRAVRPDEQAHRHGAPHCDHGDMAPLEGRPNTIVGNPLREPEDGQRAGVQGGDRRRPACEGTPKRLMRPERVESGLERREDPRGHALGLPRPGVEGDDRAGECIPDEGEPALSRVPARLVELPRGRVEEDRVDQGGGEVGERSHLVTHLVDPTGQPGENRRFRGPGDRQRRARKEIGEREGDDRKPDGCEECAEIAVEPSREQQRREPDVDRCDAEQHPALVGSGKCGDDASAGKESAYERQRCGQGREVRRLESKLERDRGPQEEQPQDGAHRNDVPFRRLGLRDQDRSLRQRSRHADGE